MLNYDYNTLYCLYVNQGYSTTDIAKMYGKNPSTIWHKLKRLEIPIRKGHNSRSKNKISEKTSGDNNAMWTGGKKILKGNYVGIHLPKHPYCNSQGYVPEHRIIIEKHLNRILEPSEVVHHLDGNPRNNDLSNLELLESQSVHAKSHYKERKKNNKGQLI